MVNKIRSRSTNKNRKYWLFRKGNGTLAKSCFTITCRTELGNRRLKSWMDLLAVLLERKVWRNTGIDF